MKATIAMAIWMGVACAGANPLPEYQFVDFQPPYSDDHQAYWDYLNAISDAGHIVGISNWDYNDGDIVYGFAGAPRVLPRRGAVYDVNVHGQFVGEYHEDYAIEPWVATFDGVVESLPLPKGFRRGIPAGISDTGWICGVVDDFEPGDSEAVFRPWVIDPQGNSISLGDDYPIEGRPWAGAVFDINDDGVAVGYMGHQVEFIADYKPVVWDPLHGARLLDVPRPEAQVPNQALAINAHGMIVGTVWDATGRRAAYWDSDGTLHLIPSNGPARAISINDQGHVVVWEGSLENARAFLWDPVHGARYIEDLLPGYYFYTPGQITNNGTVIVSYSNQPNDRNPRDTIIRPRTCPGDANGSEAVDLADVETVLYSFGWSSGPCLVGDVDCSGTVDLDDLNLVLLNFGTVCE
ncbi:MAG: hypothetical protein KDA20_10610 [Phycisphaerales bacterium]|nr:hypothetical protein [Phycisphaerales bacterium]